MRAAEDPSFCISCGCGTPHAWQRRDLRGRLKGFAILRCLRCRLGRTDPAPGDPYRNEAKSGATPLSGEEIRARLAASPVLSPWAREVARVLIERRVPQPVLDLGCGEGDLLAELSAAGYECRGLELRPSSVRVASVGRGVRVSVGTIESFLAAPEPVGTIVLSHVVEHLPDPVAVLAALSRHATSLAVAVPQSLSVRALVEWSRYPGSFAYAPAEHVWQITRPGLRGILRRAGLRPTYLASRPLKSARRSLVDTLAGVVEPQSSPLAEPLPSQRQPAGTQRLAGLWGKAVFQLFDRSLLALEQRTDLLGDQLVALAERDHGPSNTR
jgi:SAM-dependent methyltransferase